LSSQWPCEALRKTVQATTSTSRFWLWVIQVGIPCFQNELLRLNLFWTGVGKSTMIVQFGGLRDSSLLPWEKFDLLKKEGFILLTVDDVEGRSLKLQVMSLYKYVSFKILRLSVWARYWIRMVTKMIDKCTPLLITIVSQMCLLCSTMFLAGCAPPIHFIIALMKHFLNNSFLGIL
jgi:hypothetical protein